VTPLLTLVVAATVLTWLAIIVAGTLRSGGVSPSSVKLAAGNRDNLPEPSPLAGRADRAAKNTAENLVLFVALALVAQIAVPDSPRALLGAQIFFWCRVAYLPIYYAGIPYVRTAVWAVSVVGLGLMVAAVL
jgi:uncharacterized MAPEG superfamily protein